MGVYCTSNFPASFKFVLFNKSDENKFRSITARHPYIITSVYYVNVTYMFPIHCN